MVEMVIFNIYYGKRVITPKVGNQSYGSFVLHILTLCFTFERNFMKISHRVFNLQSGHKYMVEMAMFNVQRAMTAKVGNQGYRS